MSSKIGQDTLYPKVPAQPDSSDTRIWAGHGIQSVNLSAGYTNEHTEEESLNIAACYNVTKLLKAIFTEARELRRTSRHIQVRNTIMTDLEVVQ